MKKWRIAIEPENKNQDPFWFRTYLLRIYLLGCMMLFGIVVILGLITQESYVFFALICLGFLLLPLYLHYRQKNDLAGFILLVGSSLLLFIRAYDVSSGYLLTLLGIIIIVSGILLPKKMILVLFGLDLGFITFGMVMGRLRLDQVEDPENGLIYADTLSVALPLILISVIIAYTLSNIVFGTIRTQQQKEAALIDSKRRMEAILSAIPDILFIFDRDTKFVDYYASDPNLLLLKPEQFLNKKATEVLPPELGNLVVKELNLLFSTKKPQLYYYEIDLPDGKHFFEGRMVQYGEDKGLSIVRDISGIKKNEQERQKLQEQLLQLQKMDALGRLAGGIAHDFNNILVPIMGFAELGLLEITPDNPLYNDFKLIKDAANRAADLTRQILAFSRKQVLSTKIIDLNSLIRNFQEMIHRLIGEDIEIRLSLDPNLTPIKADRGELERVLLNLILNSRDAMPQGGILTIETTNHSLDSNQIEKIEAGLKPGFCVLLAVSDTGIGMDANTLQHIFEPFFTTKPAGKGTGLGLPTVYGIIKQHEGHITCYSEKDHGTTFKIYLPRAETTELSKMTPETPSDVKLNGSETILVVEDDVMVRKLVCDTLKTYGYKILEASDPQDALKIANEFKNPIPLMVSDVIMPKMNGQELFEKLILIRSNLKVLFISGYAENGIKNHGVLKEGVNFLQKPFAIKDLASKVRKILDS